MRLKYWTINPITMTQKDNINPFFYKIHPGLVFKIIIQFYSKFYVQHTMAWQGIWSWTFDVQHPSEFGSTFISCEGLAFLESSINANQDPHIFQLGTDNGFPILIRLRIGRAWVQNLSNSDTGSIQNRRCPVCSKFSNPDNMMGFKKLNGLKQRAVACV